MELKETKWFEKIVNNLLTDQVNVLNQWRKQELTTSQRVKNFENWLLVELVCKLRENGVEHIKTNGVIKSRSYKEMPKWDGTFLKIATFDDSERPGELLTLDIPFLAGVGIGPIGARIRILPFALGVGTIAYDPKPNYNKAEKKAHKKEPKK